MDASQLHELISGVRVPPRPAGGWISTIRTALGMTQTELANRMGITRQSLDQLEKNEVKETASLAAVRRAADALGYELHYILTPRDRD